MLVVYVCVCVCVCVCVFRLPPGNVYVLVTYRLQESAGCLCKNSGGRGVTGCTCW